VKVLVDWLLAQRQRLVIVAIVTAPLLPILTAGIQVINTVNLFSIGFRSRLNLSL